VQLADDSPDEFEVPDAPLPTASRTMAAHARGFVSALAQAGLARPGANIVEVASHGGHLRPFFAEAGLGTTVLEPSPIHAGRLRREGARVIEVSLQSAGEADAVAALGPVDLLVDHYLLAHLRDPDAALTAAARLLAEDGRFVLEFDHLLPTVTGLQVDAFRHGHRSYMSLTWLAGALRRHDLTAVAAEPQPVYGGALRVTARRSAAGGDPEASVAEVLGAEAAARLGRLETYHDFAAGVRASRAATRRALHERAAAGGRVAAYGAPARAVTLLNYYGLGQPLLAFTADASPAKQGRAIPGVRLPIVTPADLHDARPDDVLILTWDIAEEVVQQLEGAGSWGARYLVPIPRLHEAGVA